MFRFYHAIYRKKAIKRQVSTQFLNFDEVPINQMNSNYERKIKLNRIKHKLRVFLFLINRLKLNNTN